MVPAAMPFSTLARAMNMPAIAIATVMPERITVRPEVRTVVASASSVGAPSWRSWRERTT